MGMLEVFFFFWRRSFQKGLICFWQMQAATPPPDAHFVVSAVPLAQMVAELNMLPTKPKPLNPELNVGQWLLFQKSSVFFKYVRDMMELVL